MLLLFARGGFFVGAARPRCRTITRAQHATKIDTPSISGAAPHTSPSPLSLDKAVRGVDTLRGDLVSAAPVAVKRACAATRHFLDTIPHFMDGPDCHE